LDLQTEFKAGVSWAGNSYLPSRRPVTEAERPRRTTPSMRAAATKLWPAGLHGYSAFSPLGQRPHRDAASAGRRSH